MSYKVLGQVAPNTGVDDLLYGVPGGSSAVVSSLTVCNKGDTAASFRVNVSTTGFIDPEGYIYYDVEVQGNSTFVFTGGITLGGGDGLYVTTSAGSNGVLSFNLFGKEIA